MKFFNIGKINVPTSIIRSIAIIKRSAAIVHKKDKYDKNFLAIDPEMKNAVKRLFFSNEEEIHYDYIYCRIY